MEYLRQGIDKIHREKVHSYLTQGEAEQDREIAHERALNLAERIQKHDAAIMAMSLLFTYKSKDLKTEVAGIQMRSPLGLAAGFDKNARIHRLLGEGLGFGSVSVGSITRIPYEGSLQPRIFDLPESDGLINRMGFPGDGSNIVQAKLDEDEHKHFREYSLIINLAASKKSFEAGTQIEDYAYVSNQFLDYGDGHEVNVSSPNTEGVRGLQEPDIFKDLAQKLEPIYVLEGIGFLQNLIYKFGPDLPMDHLLKNIKTAKDNGAQGVNLGNTTTSSEIRNSLKGDISAHEVGGVSGKPLKEYALERAHRVYMEMGEDMDIILTGGIQNGEDMWNAVTYGGAKSVEVYSAFVRPNTSTPNFTYNLLRDLHRGMKVYEMTSMDDFKQYRGKRLPFPKF